MSSTSRAEVVWIDDWDCKNCKYPNFARNKRCLECWDPRPGERGAKNNHQDQEGTAVGEEEECEHGGVIYERVKRSPTSSQGIPPPLAFFTTREKGTQTDREEKPTAHKATQAVQKRPRRHASSSESSSSAGSSSGSSSSSGTSESGESFHSIELDNVIHIMD